ncbi:MAG: hypothetical protein ACLQVD_07795 [Capsulimonadaceae bacterium]
MAEYIRQHSASTDTVAMIGNEPELFFLAHRRSATGYIYIYPLFEIQKYAVSMQGQMMNEVSMARPRFIVVDTRAEWGFSSLFVRRLNVYLSNYQAVGVVDVKDRQPTDSVWNDSPREALLMSQQPIPPAGQLWIMERRPQSTGSVK